MYSRAVLTIIAIVMAALCSIGFILQPLRPWPDQGWVLQAAVRHSQGLALTSQMNAPASPIDQPQFVHLSYFPPLYPLIVSSLLSIGLLLGVVVKGINLLAMLFGTYAWCQLAFTYIERTITRVAYIGLLVLAGSTVGSATIPTGCTVDYVFWAALPLWMALLVRSARVQARPAALYLAAASVLVASLIGFRWAAAALVPIGCAAILLQRPRKLSTGVMLCVAYGLPATAAYFGIKYYNSVHSTSGESILDSLSAGWRWNLLLNSYPIEAITTIPLGTDAIASRIARLGVPRLSDITVRLASILATCFLLFWSGYRWLNTPAAPESKDTSSLLGIAIPLLLGTIFFLAFMTVRYNWDHVSWSFLEEPRYFRPIAPAALLLWLMFVDRTLSNSRSSQTLLFIGLIAVAYLVQAQFRTASARWEDNRERHELATRVLSIGNEDRLSVVLDIDISDYIVTSPSNTLFGHLVNDERLFAIEEPIDLYVVNRTAEATAYIENPEQEKELIRGILTTTKAERVWTSTAGRFELWRATMHPD